MRKIIIAAALIALSSCVRQAAPVSGLDGHEKEIDAIISGMTIEEKVAMLHGNTMFSSAGVPRLGIADIKYADGPFGIREELEPHSWRPLNLDTDYATFFPTGSALAATWSPEIARLYGKGMAVEARLRGKDMILGPAINIQRIPTGGRTYEYLSEDPILSGELAKGYTLGVQENGAAVCLKHYALNNQEDFRSTVDVQVSERAMREIYLTPFEMAVREADAWGVMSAYNKVNGYWCSENEHLLIDILRRDWGFKGIVISDWGGTHSTAAVQAGLNVEMPGATSLGQPLLDSLKAGVVPESAVDQRVRELLRVRLALPAVPEDEANKYITSKPEQQKIAYDVASRSIVLLKNGGALPLDPSAIRSIAVIGDNAVSTNALGGFGAGVKALYEITPLQGLQSRIGAEVDIKYAQGYKRYSGADRSRRTPLEAAADPALLKEAVALAAKSDIVLFFAGDNREVETESADRRSITLPNGQDELLEAIAAVNPRIVTVVVAGAPVDLGTVDKLSDAVVVSWFNGSEGGNALADILLGRIAPSGKLPFTFPRKLSDSPAYALGVYPQQLPTVSDNEDLPIATTRARRAAGIDAPYSEGILVGYRWFDTKGVDVAYPFGHGLSYTGFEYSDVSATLSRGELKVSFSIANTGDMAAEEVAQVYVSRPASKVERPAKELKGFARVCVDAGATKQVTVTIPVDRLRHWDEAEGGWKVEKGPARLLVGSSSRDIRLTADIDI